jgi:hypothetical protein
VTAAEPLPQTNADAPSATPTSATSTTAASDSTPPVAASSESSRPVQSLERDLARNFVVDQKNFWTSPLRLRVEDASWLLPLAAGATVVVLSDGSIEKKLPTSTNLISRSKSFSDYGAAGYAGLVGGGYLLASATHNDHLRETAVLGGEAAANSLLITEGIKYIAGRQRPLEGDGTGDFRRGGSSFPSMHSAGAWAIASVIAREYPGPLTKLFAYGGAAAISAARVTGRQHFASDALVGSAIGFYVGRQVYNAHNNRENPDSLYGTFQRSSGDRGPRDPAYTGSPYVPLDSWVYPAIERLAALGYIDTAFAGMRPWTRIECARLVEEAQEREESSTDDVGRTYVRALAQEFAPERGNIIRRAVLESIYTRMSGISGQPLTDGFHFGQTTINDFGRPYQEGFSNVTGFSAYSNLGAVTVYVRGEYQHAPGAPSQPLSARELISKTDDLPVPPAVPVPAINRFKLLDAYIGLNLQDWQLTIGKQSLEWGPGEGGAMLLSDNIEPIRMVRLSRVSPFKLPSVFGWLGPIRTEFFVGQLNGSEFIRPSGLVVGQWGQSLDPQPIIHGQKLSFSPTRNIQFGIFRTTIYGGPRYPLTLRTLSRSLFSSGNTLGGDPAKPGDRRSGVDFTYRVPKLRKWLTFYADGFTDDEVSPIAYADRSVWRAGIYMPVIPRISKLDLRAEGVYSDDPIGGAVGPGFFYNNFTWATGYRNAGNLIGSWIGRAGQGAQAWATYHFSSTDEIQVNFRHQKVSHEFLPGGATLADMGARTVWSLHRNLTISGALQYERWTMPVLQARRESNITTSIQFTFRPDWGK